MGKKSNRRMAIVLFVVWLISVFVLYIGSGLEWVVSQFSGMDSTDIHSLSDIMIIVINVVYFIPMLALISRYSYLAGMKRLRMFTQVLIPILSIIACIAFISLFMYGIS